MALTVMIPSHTQPGSIFKQTADFEAPHRSDVYDGRYTLASPLPVYTMVTASPSRSPISVHRQRVIPLSVFFKTLYDGAQIKNLTIRANMQELKKEWRNVGRLFARKRDAYECNR